MEHLTTVKELHEAGMFMKENDLVWGTAGNISARDGGNQFYISSSGTHVGNMNVDDFSLCSFEEGWVSGKKPSKEYNMHRAVYEERPEIGAILHASPFYSTLIACSAVELPSNYFVEAMYYLERVERIPYFHPGSRELADAVKEKAKDTNVMLLENHGVLVYDENIKEARMALQTMEYTAKMHITAIEKGITMQGMSKDQEHDFLQNSGYKPVRNWSR
ncbi:class II aldolase/adducin family protein [Salibacterium qingdaonense]|uniref:Ribulose-5-phosphate 4-epimerase/Fuculose-1-phosphate aldolase n=1 Tax=Salibacterium qingdaonense TaxID=266892 RepID=A0A1I4PLM0_9BACI|nr:class II aldolase/adducin family protein [Salibacterium qingdaonense]SFM28350.1 Ribulose-5-phosphate 4-epimerase/Fuculose-1-phosphate aldolase [Salibacterium qingdaonense]